MIDDRRLRELAARQHGVVAVEQAIALGFTKHQRLRLIDGRRWERGAGRVYRLVGTPATGLQRASEAVLGAGPGASLNGSSALAHWGVRGVLLEPIQVDRVRNHVDRPSLGARHEPLLLPDHHAVVLDGIRTAVPARAIFELAGSQRRGAELQWWVDRIERIVNNAISDRLVSFATLHEMLDELAQRGRPGIRVMRQVLSQHDPAQLVPASGLETRVEQMCRRAGLEPLRRQVDLGDAGRWIGRVDFVDRHLPFVLEVQSERFHGSDVDRQLDATRIQRLEAAGFVVREVSDDDVWYRPDVVIATILEGRQAAATRVARAALHQAA